MIVHVSKFPPSVPRRTDLLRRRNPHRRLPKYSFLEFCLTTREILYRTIFLDSSEIQVSPRISWLRFSFGFGDAPRTKEKPAHEDRYLIEDKKILVMYIARTLPVVARKLDNVSLVVEVVVVQAAVVIVSFTPHSSHIMRTRSSS